MKVEQRILNFEKLGFGLFIHFGLYSMLGKGEWYEQRYCYHSKPEFDHGIQDKEYEALTDKFTVENLDFKKIIKMAYDAGIRYACLTTRHHDGFSLYDNSPLNTFDSLHSACHRDIVREFVDACNEIGVVPFFYHTLIDWHFPMKDENGDMEKYLRYLEDSLKILCTKYGKIGGFWFDGNWYFKEGEFPLDRIFRLIRKYQPDTMIINNTGMSHRGEKGTDEIDSVTFERGGNVTRISQNNDKYLAMEKCQVFNNHWGYAKDDINIMSVENVLDDLFVCRSNGSNLLFNVGPKGDGSIRLIEQGIFEELATFNKYYGEVLRCKPSEVKTSNQQTFLLENEKNLYVIVKDTYTNGAFSEAKEEETITLSNVSRKVVSVETLDDHQKIDFKQDKDTISFKSKNFDYGINLIYRIYKLKYED